MDRASWRSTRTSSPMLPAAKRGPPSSARSTPSWRSSLAGRRPADEGPFRGDCGGQLGLRRRVLRPPKATQDDKSGQRDHGEVPKGQTPAEHAVAACEVEDGADPERAEEP